MLAQRVNDGWAGLPNVLATKQRQLVGVHTVALHGVQNVVVGQAVGHAAIKVVHAIRRGRMHNARAVGVAHIVGQIQGR